VDFTAGQTQQAVAEAAAHVLGGYARGPAGQRGQPGPGAGQDGPATGQDGPATGQEDSYDLALWKELAQAGLLGLAVPGPLGGEGLGVAEIAVLLTEVGRAAAPVPALATLAMGVLPVTRWGSRDQQQALLAGVAAGDTLLAAAIREPSEPMPPVPATTLRDGTGAGPGTVSGVKIGVPHAAAANWILVPASLGSGGTVIAVVEPPAAGVTLGRTPSSAAAPEYTVRLDEAPAAHILGGNDAVADLYQLTAAACCLADGALAAALALTTSHVRTRQQFGRPLATFQAVAQQIADVAIASRALHLATLSACWRLDTGREAGSDTDVAAYWLAAEVPAAMRACHHLHGGTGMDVSYPLHRYSALAKDLVNLVGGADYRLGLLGDRAG
jgi:alkylation response protein AidB-like acyl-CoA dehydrogenase